MAPEILSTLMNEARQKVNGQQYVEALRIIREAKIVDLHNLYIAALEQFVTKLSHIPSQELNQQNSAEYQRVFTVMIERALDDEKRRSRMRAQHYGTVDEQTLGKEKMKNFYFQRTDELLEQRQYVHALEEVRRVYFFDSDNIVANEYEQKLQQLIALDEKQAES
jgi:hypothetical protein